MQKEGIPLEKKLMKATFAGGCFWCMQPPFQQTEGVIGAVAGYAGGLKANPSYEEVSSGTTGHLESVQVTYDPEKVPYEKLLDVFWMQIDPTDAEGQFADKGSQYQTAIFYHDDEQKRMAEFEKNSTIQEVQAIYYGPAIHNVYSKVHQNYAQKKPREYQQYRKYSGREAFIEKTWKTRAKVRVYSTPRCHNCHEIKEYLRLKNVEFEEIDLASDKDAGI
jgi:methionine-S-sulfoxide reductase